MNLIRRIISDRKGTAALELGLAMPVLLLLLMGSAETVNLLRVDGKVQTVGFSTADLFGLKKDLTTDRVNDIFRAAELMMQPFSAASLKIGVVSVVFDPDDGTPSIDWQETKNGGSVPDALTRAAGMGAPGQSVIIVAVEFAYDPVLRDAVFPALTLSETVIGRPRESSKVTRI